MAIKKYIPLTLILVFFAACTSLATAPLPLKDIVFQAPYNKSDEVGFIDSTNGSIEIFPTDDYIIRPVWSHSGNLLFGLARDNQSILAGTPSYWDKDGNQKKCKNLHFSSDQVEPFGDVSEYIVLVADTNLIEVVDMSNCKIQITIVNLSNQGRKSVVGVSYSPINNSLLYGLQDSDLKEGFYQANIIQLDMSTKEEKILAGGLNPSWSPDGSQFAFVKVDGIYILNIGNTIELKVFSKNYRNNMNNEFIDYYSAPYPNWSPDGTKLIFHSCEKEICNGNMEYSIVTLDLSTEKKEVYPQFGLYPDWRPQIP